MLRQQLDPLAEENFVELGVNVLAFELPGPGVTTFEPVFTPESLEDALGRMPLLPGNAVITPRI